MQIRNRSDCLHRRLPSAWRYLALLFATPNSVLVTQVFEERGHDFATKVPYFVTSRNILSDRIGSYVSWKNLMLNC